MAPPSLYNAYNVLVYCSDCYESKFEQGEDVVAGIRTPEDINTMKICMPEAYKELVENCEILERHYKDMMVKCSFLMLENGSFLFISVLVKCSCSVLIHLQSNGFFFLRFQLCVTMQGLIMVSKYRILNSQFKKIGYGCCSAGPEREPVEVQ